MANYKNTRARSYVQQRRSFSGGILKTLGAVLVVFLAIGLIGSLFSRPSDSADADKKDPTTATDPTDAPSAKLCSFTFESKEYEFEEGMTWEQYLESDYSDGTFSAKENGNVNIEKYSMELLFNNSTKVLLTDAIVNGGSYGP